ncbi:hypothetical protein MGG_15609 [Pyricularia oryzae 70-15]|uniref:Uncharacterized protein n=3 Tax=Pyricularia oryzae TaxID=318829 RepID=G4MVN5_PYRO7|nr:uncharacterized protein MGG_15609 [Pyricularia oryzae 70-15]EHA54144.1 hypothetical protein MGG_15609 [Pyricularia oryzae 70-15]ELQ42016.1 hypothetical protein OOU_Y34scaffold00240g23 [Pyricularia oryzae Y34]
MYGQSWLPSLPAPENHTRGSGLTLSTSRVRIQPNPTHKYCTVAKTISHRAMDVTVSSRLGKHDVHCSTDLIRPMANLATTAKSSLSIISGILTFCLHVQRDTTDVISNTLGSTTLAGDFQDPMVEEEAGLSNACTIVLGRVVKLAILDRSAKPESFAGKPDHWPMINMGGQAVQRARQVAEIVHLVKRQKIAGRNEVLYHFLWSTNRPRYEKTPLVDFFFSPLGWSVCVLGSIAVAARSSGVQIVITVAPRQHVTRHNEA